MHTPLFAVLWRTLVRKAQFVHLCGAFQFGGTVDLQTTGDAEGLHRLYAFTTVVAATIVVLLLPATAAFLATIVASSIAISALTAV